jgi:hypothetical protein
MTPPQPPPPYGWAPTPHGPPPAAPKRNWWRSAWFVGLVGLIVGIAIGAGAESAGSKNNGRNDAVGPVSPTASAPAVVNDGTSPTRAPTTLTPPPPAVPKPKGKYTGTCDYTLVFASEAHTGDLIGQVNLTNTGNIGTVLKVRMSWTQVGYRPITLIKNVKVPYRGHKVVPFHRPASQTEIDRLQAANYGDECSYKATITDTFGTAHG